MRSPARVGLRTRMRRGRRSEQTGIISGKHKVTLPAKTQMSKRPRPVFDPKWAVRGDGENDFAEDLHTKGKKLNFSEHWKRQTPRCRTW